MKTLKYLGVATLLAVGLATGAHAADVVTFAAAGSSAQYATFTQAFYNSGYGTPTSGGGHYTLGGGTNFQVADPTPGVPKENAQVAIYWQGSPGNYTIAVFYQVDSTVGVRAFFNGDTLTVPATAPAPANPSLGAPFAPNAPQADVVPPAEVLTAIAGTVVNVGATDITPEDARVATQRTLNLGYTTTNPIMSALHATTTATPVPFTITAPGTFRLTPLGAVPLVVFINNNKGSQFASLSGANLNINSFQLAGFLSGQLNRTSDLNLASNALQNPVHTYIREPLSGTYNTMEFCNPSALAEAPYTGSKPSGTLSDSGGQELNVAATNNPLNEPVNGSADFNAPGGSGRIRSIGTGQLVGDVNVDTTDALGYAFYSAGTFATSKSGNLRYITVDGADPIQDSYTGGTLPGSVSFRNIVNGGYPLWSVLRVLTAATPTANVNTIVTAAQNANLGTDFVTFQALRVFRSYHQTPYTVGAARNGNNGPAANGGDVGGAVFSINNDQANFADFGSDLTNRRQ